MDEIRLIDATALKKAIYEWRYHGYYDKLIEVIDNAPTFFPFAKVEIQTFHEYERPHAEWQEVKGEYVRDNIFKIALKCSYCGHVNSYYSLFCPNCGADMYYKEV